MFRTGGFRSIWIIVLALVIGAARARAQPADTISQIRSRVISGSRTTRSASISSRAPATRSTRCRSIRTSRRSTRWVFSSSVTADVSQQGDRLTLIYHVNERPMVTDVRLEGMKAIRTTDDKVLDATKLHARAILDPVARPGDHRGTQEGLRGQRLPRRQRHLQHRSPQPDNQAIAVFNVNEGPLVHITDDRFHRQSRFHRAGS